MDNSINKAAVKGATKSKCAPPKQKYLDILLAATARSDYLETIFTSLDSRLRESSWTIVFKSLIVIHILIRQGTGDQVLNHLIKKPNILNISGFKDKSGTGNGIERTKNIHSYAAYLEKIVSVYRESKVNFLKEKKGTNSRLRTLTVAKGLLREVKILQQQLDALLRCKFYLDGIDNEVTLMQYKLIISDLLSLFETMNGGVINVLDQLISMSQIDARNGLEIYKEFVKLTEKVVSYLNIAQKISGLGINIPNFKHAPVSMTNDLQEYVEDPNFEANRREYKRIQEEKNNNNKSTVRKDTTKDTTKSTLSNNNDNNIKSLNEKDIKSTTLAVDNNNNNNNNNTINYIDFFSSIENEQVPLFGNQYVNNNSLGRSNTIITTTTTNPFLTTQNPLILQQQSSSSSLMLNPMSSPSLLSLSPATSIVSDTNPFRASMLFQDQQIQQQTISTTNFSPHNPFGQLPQTITSSPIINHNNSNPFTSQGQQQNLSISSNIQSQSTSLSLISSLSHTSSSSSSSSQLLSTPTSSLPLSSSPSLYQSDSNPFRKSILSQSNNNDIMSTTSTTTTPYFNSNSLNASSSSNREAIWN